MKCNLGFVIFFLFFLPVYPLCGQRPFTREEYVERFKEIAVAEMKRTGIPASITLAQGILESGSGNGRLALEANNHFGIKCHDWTGPSIRHDDDAPGECFRKYRHPEESYRDHSEFLMTRSRYGFLFDYPYTDYVNWAHGLKKAGYATNPQYAQLLIKIIEETRLHQYDDLNYKSSRVEKLGKHASLSPDDINIKNGRIALNGYVLYEVNGIKVIVAGQGDSFTSLALGLRMNPARLAAYNDLEKDYPLYPGQWVFLSRKKAKAPRGDNYHTVKEGESLYNIAQMYGMRLESLYQLNGLAFDAPEPAPSTVLSLRKKKKISIAMDCLISGISLRSDVRIHLPASKSISNRVLIIRALSGDHFPIHNLSESDDTRVMMKALQENTDPVNIGHAGTAMRFLTAYFAASAHSGQITGSERMLKRPIEPLVRALNELGAEITYEGQSGFPPVKTSGRPLKGGALTISAQVSSQFITALLLIAPVLPGGLSLRLDGKIVSASYIRMTLALMKQFGVDSCFESSRISIPSQAYAGKEYVVESDWSAASYWYQIISLIPDSEVFLEGLSRESVQGDAKVAALFSLLGVGSLFKEDGVRLTRTAAHCEFFEADFIECPDLVQTMVVTLCLLGIPFRITGAETLRIKETDRISALQHELLKLGYFVQEPAEGVLTGDGKRKPVSGSSLRIATYDDHRMAMSFAPAGLLFPGLVIEDARVVSKSYPDYWKDLVQFGVEAGSLS